MNEKHFVIVGAGLAGGTAAMRLREEGFAGRLTLVGADQRPPYHRPPLSKTYLRGEEPLQDVLVHPASSYAAAGIDVRLGARAVALDPRSKVIELEGGSALAYDRLLVTTGGRNRRPAIAGLDLEGVLQLRTLDEADRIRAEARPGRKAVVVGMGFIGSEVSASLRMLGVEVTAIEGARTPLERVLGTEVGNVLADIHRERGVDLIVQDSVAAFEGAQRLERVLTGSGRAIECDFAVVGIGISPNVELLEEAGADVQNGVLVDELCRTSLPDVFAAGDLTNHKHPVFGRLRVEHWNNAFQQGGAAARSMVGQDRPYDYVHSFWSDQYDQKIEYLGFAKSWDQLIFRGKPGDRRFLAFYLDRGVLRAVLGLNRGGDPEDPEHGGELKDCLPLVRKGRPVDPALLADEDCDLALLASAAP